MSIRESFAYLKWEKDMKEYTRQQIITILMVLSAILIPGGFLYPIYLIWIEDYMLFFEYFMPCMIVSATGLILYAISIGFSTIEELNGYRMSDDT